MKKPTKKGYLIAALSFVMVSIIVLAIALPVYYLVDKWYSWQKYDVTKVTALDFKDGAEEFKILQLTDTHLQSEEQLDYARESFKELIDASSPDMIVFTGDFIWKKHTKELLPKVLAMIDEFEIPYAFTYGNHDLEGNAKVKDFLKAFKKSKYGIYQRGPKNITGNANYSINIRQNGKIVYTLMMLDSLRYAKAPGTIRGYNYIHDDQVDYYEWNIKGLSKAVYGEYNPDENKVVPSLLFFHIPQLQFFDIRDKIIDYYNENSLEMGTETPWGVATLSDDAEYPNPRQPNNIKESDEWLYPIKYTSLLDRAVSLKSTRAIFVGHLHYNSGYYKYYDKQIGYGLELVHGTKTLTTSLYWGCEDEETETKVGGTIITIKPDGSYSYDRLASTIFAPEFKH